MIYKILSELYICCWPVLLILLYYAKLIHLMCCETKSRPSQNNCSKLHTLDDHAKRRCVAGKCKVSAGGVLWKAGWIWATEEGNENIMLSSSACFNSITKCARAGEPFLPGRYNASFWTLLSYHVLGEPLFPRSKYPCGDFIAGWVCLVIPIWP